jgi:hypothetical protein
MCLFDEIPRRVYTCVREMTGTISMLDMSNSVGRLD